MPSTKILLQWQSGSLRSDCNCSVSVMPDSDHAISGTVTRIECICELLVPQEDLDFKAALELSLEARLVVGALQVMHVMHPSQHLSFLL